MRITREDSTDLGFVRYCHTFGAVNHEDITLWASRAIDEESDPPTFLYDMLDVRNISGDELDRRIGYISGYGAKTDEEFDYIRQIAVRRGLQPYSYLGSAENAILPPDRKKYIDDLFAHNFNITVDHLPQTHNFKPI